MRSCLIAQLTAQGEVLGIMCCYHPEVHTFSLEEISLLVAVAEQLGISLENRRLRREAELAAVSSERRRLARDLHDSITQSIYSLTLFTRASIDALNTGDQIKLANNLEQIEKNALISLKDLRLLLYQMQPPDIQGRLSERINTRLDLVERRLGIEATCQVDEKVFLSSEMKADLFGIILEALNNSLKHAQASQVNILLERKNGDILLEIEDDGQGFVFNGQDRETLHQGMGLKNMFARAADLGGYLEIFLPRETAPG